MDNITTNYVDMLGYMENCTETYIIDLINQYASLTGFRKNIYYQKSNTVAVTPARTISQTTSSTLSFDTTKKYLVNISYSFDLVGSGSAHIVSFAIRDSNQTKYDEVQFDNPTNLHLVNLTFRIEPLLASTPLTLLVSCGPHNVINTANDVIIWTIDEIQ
jgi:hypothetical protein